MLASDCVTIIYSPVSLPKFAMLEAKETTTVKSPIQRSKNEASRSLATSVHNHHVPKFQKNSIK